MVDPVLLEQVERLSEADLLELRGAIDAKLEDRVPAEILAEIERRLDEMGPEPAVDYITLDEFKHQARSQHRVA